MNNTKNNATSVAEQEQTLNNAPEVEQTNAPEVEQEQPAEVVKANAILRQRIDALQSRGLNFEKRRRAWFTATIEEDENGKEVTRRLGIDTEEYLNKLTDAERAEVLEAMNIKTAAADVAEYEKERAALVKYVDEARAALAEAEKAVEEIDARYTASVEAVNAYELPEKVRAERVKLSARVEEQSATIAAQTAAIEAMRAKLLALGIDPDSI